MARIRSIKPEFWADELVASWPMETRLAYIALWNEADDEGRLRASHAYLRSRLFPYDLDLDMAAVLRPLERSGRLVVYEADGQTYGHLPRFTEHQVVNRPSPSKLPAPPEVGAGGINHDPAPQNEDSRRTHGGLTEDSHQEGKGREGNREQGREEGEPDAAPADAGPPPPDSDVPYPRVLQAAWNEGAHPDLPRWQELNAKRKAAATARLRERRMDGPEGWRAVIARISTSAFCRGENDRGWRASPDWLLQPDTAAKVLEGKYDDRSRGGSPQPPTIATGHADARRDGDTEMRRCGQCLEYARHRWTDDGWQTDHECTSRAEVAG